MPTEPRYEHTPDGQVWLRALKANRLLYPSEFVVRWLARVRPELPSDCNALDMGFGSGQHLQLFMDYGLRAWGTELLAHAVESGERQFRGQALAGRLILGDLDHPALPAHGFGAVLNWGSLFFRPIEGMRASLMRMAHLLQPGGRALFNLRSCDNWFYGMGTEGPARHWLLDHRAGPYSGCGYTFLDQNEACDLLEGTGLMVERLERTDWWKNGATERHSWWVVQARRL